MSIDILAGFAGRTSLGHGAIFGVATYVVLWWVSVPGGSVWLAMPLGSLGCDGAGGGLRRAGDPGVRRLFPAADARARHDGVGRVPALDRGDRRRKRAARAIRPPEFADTPNVLQAVLAVTSVLAFGMWRFVRSPFGLTLRGIRDSESRMRASATTCRCICSWRSRCRASSPGRRRALCAVQRVRQPEHRLARAVGRGPADGDHRRRRHGVRRRWSARR